jgi:hypothetical protein
LFIRLEDDEDLNALEKVNIFDKISINHINNNDASDNSSLKSEDIEERVERHNQDSPVVNNKFGKTIEILHSHLNVPLVINNPEMSNPPASFSSYHELTPQFSPITLSPCLPSLNKPLPPAGLSSEPLRTPSQEPSTPLSGTRSEDSLPQRYTQLHSLFYKYNNPEICSQSFPSLLIQRYRIPIRKISSNLNSYYFPFFQTQFLTVLSNLFHYYNNEQFRSEYNKSLVHYYSGF